MLTTMEISTIDCGKEQPYQPRDMSDSSQYLYGHPPPDIMPKGLSNNGTVACKRHNSMYTYTRVMHIPHETHTYIIRAHVHGCKRLKLRYLIDRDVLVGIGGRLRQLEGLFIGGPVQSGRVGHTISIETLIDVLLVLYDECCNSSLRREKTVSDFIEFGKCPLDIRQR